jgi:hypothetical protein
MSVDADAIWYDLRFGPCDRRTYGTGHREPRRRVSRPRPLTAEERLELTIRAQEDLDAREHR